MAARRATSSVNWSALGARMTGPGQRAVFSAAKTGMEAQMMKIAASPAALPKMDFEAYKRMLPGVAMVDDFQAQYEALSIAYPVDAVGKTAAAVAADGAIKAAATAVKAEVDDKCAGSKKDIAFFEKLPSALSMTYEMYLELFPNADSVVPKEREVMEAELAEINAQIADYQSKKA